MQDCNENVEQFLRVRIFQEDIRTGELVNELSLEENYVVNIEEEKRAKERREVKSRQYYKRRSPMPFVWSVYKLSTRLLEELPGKYVAMLFYLATFDGYGGYLTTGKKPVLRKQLPKILSVTETTAYRFWKSLFKAGIATEDAEGKLSLNEEYFQIGSLERKTVAVLKEQEMYLSRAYVKSIRDLYEASQPGTRNCLGHLFQILPFVNREYNIVCYNPLETELEKIRPMSFGEVCEAIRHIMTNGVVKYSVTNYEAELFEILNSCSWWYKERDQGFEASLGCHQERYAFPFVVWAYHRHGLTFEGWRQQCQELSKLFREENLSIDHKQVTGELVGKWDCRIENLQAIRQGLNSAKRDCTKVLQENCFYIPTTEGALYGRYNVETSTVDVCEMNNDPDMEEIKQLRHFCKNGKMAEGTKYTTYAWNEKEAIETITAAYEATKFYQEVYAVC